MSTVKNIRLSNTQQSKTHNAWNPIKTDKHTKQQENDP